MYISNSSNIGMSTLLQQNKNCMKTIANGNGNIIVSNVVGGNSATPVGASVATTSAASTGSGIVLSQAQKILLTNGASGTGTILNFQQPQNNNRLGTSAPVSSLSPLKKHLLMPHDMLSVQRGNIVKSSGTSLATVAGNSTTTAATKQGAFFVGATAAGTSGAATITAHNTSTNNMNSFQQQFLQHAALIGKPITATTGAKLVNAKSQITNSISIVSTSQQVQQHIRCGTGTLQQIKKPLLQQARLSALNSYTNSTNITTTSLTTKATSSAVSATVTAIATKAAGSTAIITTPSTATITRGDGGGISAAAIANTVPNGNSNSTSTSATTTTTVAGTTSSTTTATTTALPSATTNAITLNEEEEPEIDIVINNVVCSFSVRCHLNLREIALSGFNVEYRRENGMVTMKLRRPYTTASIWSSGRITCTGATSEEQAKIAARRYARCLQKLSFPVRFHNFRVVNVLGTCSMPWAIKIVNFSEKYKKDASYEPELHPGVTYKLRYPKATLKIFSTGSITVTAASVANVQSAIEHIYPLVFEFRKKRSPQELEQLRLKQQYMKTAIQDLAKSREANKDKVAHSMSKIDPGTSKCLKTKQAQVSASSSNTIDCKRKKIEETPSSADFNADEEDADDPEGLSDDALVMYSEYDPADLIEGPDDEDGYDEDL